MCLWDDPAKNKTKHFFQGGTPSVQGPYSPRNEKMVISYIECLTNVKSDGEKGRKYIALIKGRLTTYYNI